MRPQIVVEPEGLFPIKLTRVTLDEADELRRFSVPITAGRLWLLLRNRNDSLVLPRLLLGLEAVFGHLSRLDGDGKCSFQVPLLLSGERERRSIRYLVTVGDVRGVPDFEHYRIHPTRPSKYDQFVYQPPVDSEFSRADLERLDEWLLDHFLSCGDAVARSASPFYRTVRAEQIVYGKMGDKLFVRECSVTTYESELARVQNALGEQEHLESILARIDTDHATW